MNHRAVIAALDSFAQSCLMVFYRWIVPVFALRNAA